MTRIKAPPELQADPVLDALPLGVVVVDAERRIVFMNRALHDLLDLPPDSFLPGAPAKDVVRTLAERGVYGPGDPDAHVAAVLATEWHHGPRLRRRMLNGRSFDLRSALLPDGGYVICLVAAESAPPIDAAADAERALAQTASSLSTLHLGLAAFGPDGTLRFANPRFAELLALAPQQVDAGMGFPAVLDCMADTDEFARAGGEAFVMGQRGADRSRPVTARWARGDGQVIDVTSDPLPDGGWIMAVTDVTLLVRAETEASRRARSLDAILEAIPHGVCVYGADHRVIMFNRTYAQVMAGAPIAVGDHRLEVIPPPVRGRRVRRRIGGRNRRATSLV